MGIKRNCQIGAGVVLVAMVSAIGLTAYQVNTIRFGGPVYQKNQLLSELTADILPPPEYVIESYLEASQLVSARGSVEEHKKRLGELQAQFNDRQAYWKAAPIADSLKAQLLDGSGADAQRFWTEINGQLLPAATRGDHAAMDASYANLTQIYAAHRAGINKLVEATAVAQKTLADETASTLQSTVYWLITLAMAILGLVVGGVIYISRRALAPLAATADAMTHMAQGDFDVVVAGSDRKDEIGNMVAAIEVFRANSKAQVGAKETQRVVDTVSQALSELSKGNMVHRIDTTFVAEYETLRNRYNETMDGLADIMTRVAGSASSVHTGASEIRAASDDLAQRTEQQAASLEETAAAMNQVTDMVQGTAKSAAEVNLSITEAHREANEGGRVVERAVGAMSAIEKSASEITQIINVIDGIAFQTNLLALNAGVEAARAGDAGKGFAVVANEVRALAQRSADAAKDIKALIMTSAQQVGEGVALVGETGTLLSRIVARVGEISTLITGIADSAEIQATNLRQVNGAVGEMDKMTQQNAAMVEESTAAARSLAGEADELSTLVARFDTGGPAQLAMPPVKTQRRAPPRRAPATRGNLALKVDADDEDWAEF